ncbi:MAG: formate dehydrogenase accessory sulfurtransferase FdhD [Hyphomicrobiaceae bacterium]
MATLRVGGGAVDPRERTVPVETPVAFVYNGTTYAVMMATPHDLEAIAMGFSLSEGIVSSGVEIQSLEVVSHEQGIELRMWLDEGRARRLAERRRHVAGPTGCGLCGIESLAEAVPALRPITSDARFTADEIFQALTTLAPAQELNRSTHAVHGAGFWSPSGGLVALAEDVGRHNALDKLVGTLAIRGADATIGIVLLTSRVSVEMVQKTAMAGAPVIVAVSAPTDLAIRTADAAGITLVAVARADGFEVFTHPERLGLDHKGRRITVKVSDHAA